MSRPSAAGAFFGRFSLPHYDLAEDDLVYLEAIRDTSETFRRELRDIYFGKNFRYEYRGDQKRFGNCMGVEATDAQVDNLFRIQDELGIQISLTLNQQGLPIELRREESLRDAFFDFIKSYYNRGLRSCTIADHHLMASGMLQERFPRMRWKNTVNHGVATAQSVADYWRLGYDVIQLDRSLCRNVPELRRIARFVRTCRDSNPNRPIETCLLVAESCLPDCPFKREHDDMQTEYGGGRVDACASATYWSEFGHLSCGRWRESKYARTPRAGVDGVWVSNTTFAEYASLVDVFKFSGRLMRVVRPKNDPRLRFLWACFEQAARSLPRPGPQRVVGGRSFAYAESFEELFEANLEPLSVWKPMVGTFPRGAAVSDKNHDRFASWVDGSLWVTREGRELERRLMSCRSQCWDCHACERTFGAPDVDSLVLVERG